MVILTREEICSFGSAEMAFLNIMKMTQEEADNAEIITKPNNDNTDEEENTKRFDNFLEKIKRVCERGEQKEKQHTALKRKQYDADRYKEHREESIKRAIEYKKRLKEDIPRMRAIILKGLMEGKRTWLSHKTRDKYNITFDKQTNTYS